MERLRLHRMVLAAIVLGLSLVSSCTYDKGEVIEPDPIVVLEYCDSIKAADSLMVTYTCDIRAIMDANCTNGCHTQTTPQGAPTFLETYNEVVDVVSDSLLLCVINWKGPCLIKMPYPLGSDKIDSLDRVLIEEWIVQGTIE